MLLRLCTSRSPECSRSHCDSRCLASAAASASAPTPSGPGRVGAGGRALSWASASSRSTPSVPNARATSLERFLISPKSVGSLPPSCWAGGFQVMSLRCLAKLPSSFWSSPLSSFSWRYSNKFILSPLYSRKKSVSSSSATTSKPSARLSLASPAFKRFPMQRIFRKTDLSAAERSTSLMPLLSTSHSCSRASRSRSTRRPKLRAHSRCRKRGTASSSRKKPSTSLSHT
mmetsp:Transcript_40681/g.113006  ORF Transcript_40681/g.113006 Transcript_40681/m.113006 type:complete len:229 (+) Transcript_40681:545-1231(+)